MYWGYICMFFLCLGLSADAVPSLWFYPLDEAFSAGLLVTWLQLCLPLTCPEGQWRAWSRKKDIKLFQKYISHKHQKHSNTNSHLVSVHGVLVGTAICCSNLFCGSFKPNLQAAVTVTQYFLSQWQLLCHHSALNTTWHKSASRIDTVLPCWLVFWLFILHYWCFQKPLLADEYRVDYVQVDEKKTQALQSTKMEWKDVRQSKA